MRVKYPLIKIKIIITSIIETTFTFVLSQLVIAVKNYKIITRTDGVLGEEQCGFRSWRGCVDQLFAVRQLCEDFKAMGKDLFWAFMYLEKQMTEWIGTHCGR